SGSVTPPTLAGWWKFDDGAATATDSTANHNNGSFVSGAAYDGGTTLAPLVGNVDVLKLNGTGHLSIPDSPSLNLPGNLSMAAWVRLDVNNTENTIISKDIASQFFSNYNFHVLNNKLFFGSAFNQAASFASAPLGGGACDSGGCWVTGAGTFVDANHPLGTWRHVAGTYDDATKTFRVYLDGVEDGRALMTTAAHPYQTIGEAVWIGARKAFGTPTTGRIDDVRIYNGLLS